MLSCLLCVVSGLSARSVPASACRRSGWLLSFPCWGSWCFAFLRGGLLLPSCGVFVLLFAGGVRFPVVFLRLAVVGFCPRGGLSVVVRSLRCLGLVFGGCSAGRGLLWCSVLGGGVRGRRFCVASVRLLLFARVKSSLHGRRLGFGVASFIVWGQRTSYEDTLPKPKRIFQHFCPNGGIRILENSGEILEQRICRS